MIFPTKKGFFAGVANCQVSYKWLPNPTKLEGYQTKVGRWEKRNVFTKRRHRYENQTLKEEGRKKLGFWFGWLG